MMARLVCLAALLACVFSAAPCRAVASAELIYNVPYTYGRFEARILYAAGDGVVSSFFLWKEGSEAPNAYWNELDFEKVQADCRVQTNALYGNPVNNTSQFDPIAGNLCDSYHDYVIEWTPDYIAWAVDGQEIRRETGEIANAFAQNAMGGMTFHFNVWPGNQEFGGNFDPAILPVHQYISWVQYSSYQGGSFQLEWREEFDGGLPSGWSLGSWQSPKGLSTHVAANVNIVNGIAVLSLTADNATGFSGTPPADDGSTDTGGNGGSSMSGTMGAGGTTTGGMTSGGMTNTATTAGAMNTTGGATLTTGTTSTSGSAATSTAMGAGGASGNVTAGATGTSVGGASGSVTATTLAAGGSVSGGVGGSNNAAATEDDASGCSCRLAGGGKGPPGAFLMLLAGLVTALRRRRPRASS